MTNPADAPWDWVKIRKTLGQAAIGVLVVMGVLTMLATCSGGSSSAKQYDDTTCQALRITALSESSNAEDAAVQYEVHC